MKLTFDSICICLRAPLAAFAVLVGLAFGGNLVAAPFQFTYTGVFSTEDALNLSSAPSKTPFAAPTPYTLTALFDTSSTNYVGMLPFPGFVAYAPYLATMIIGGVEYTVDSFASNPTGGITVAIFDATNIFFPGIFGAGFIQDAVQDGSGVVGDFSTATPAFSVNSLTSTTFGGYNGAGFSSGPMMGSFSRPIVLRLAGEAYNLSIGDRIEMVANGAPLNTASLTAIPEPASFVLCVAGFAGFLALRRRNASSNL